MERRGLAGTGSRIPPEELGTTEVLSLAANLRKRVKAGGRFSRWEVIRLLDRLILGEKVLDEWAGGAIALRLLLGIHEEGVTKETLILNRLCDVRDP